MSLDDYLRPENGNGDDEMNKKGQAISGTALRALLAPAFFVFLGWAILTGALGFSSEMRILFIIGLVIWWLAKKK